MPWIGDTTRFLQDYMTEVLIVRPGATTFDDAGRIKGSLDIPLSPAGIQQAEQLSLALQTVKLDCLYVAPCTSAQASARQIAERNFCRQRSIDCLRNLDHGLWQGKLLSEVKRLQPTYYRQFQDDPAHVRPPGGETVAEAIRRVQPTIDKLLSKHAGGRIAFLLPDPMASIVQCCLMGHRFQDIWKLERDGGTFEVLRLEPAPTAFELNPA